MNSFYDKHMSVFHVAARKLCNLDSLYRIGKAKFVCPCAGDVPTCNEDDAEDDNTIARDWEAGS